ncbi:hypothetical protein KKA95_05140 [Patescibacteria group bacterium]|nr:hypothetical protein [Patescibacteria group bacterium]
MNENSSKPTLDINVFVDSLIEQMNMQGAEPEKLQALKEGMLKQINNVIMDTVSLYLEPEVIDAVMEKYGDSDDPYYIYTQFVKKSPNVQLEILNALQEFEEQTMQAYKQLTQK